MSHLLGYHLFFGILFALGLWLLLSALWGWRGGQNVPARLARGLPKPGEDLVVVSDLPPLAQRVLAAPLTDLGLAVFGGRNPDKLEDRLRRSGWRYQSAGDYYGSQMAMMILLFVLGVILGVALRFPPLGLAVAAASLGAVGLYFPENNVRETIKMRRAAIYREMAWTLDRVAAVLKTGQALEQSLDRLSSEKYAWIAGGRGGLFTAILRDISAGLASRRSDMDDYLDRLRADLPEDLPELDEFLQAVRLNITLRQSIVEQLRALGSSMRNQLNNRVDEVAQKASLQVVLITSGIVVPALLLIVGGVALLQAVQVLH
jgi:Flp pilus assembly protein TadB